MTGEQLAPQPPTYQDFLDKYREEAAREFGGPAPYDEERVHRFNAAHEKIEAVLGMFTAEDALDVASGGEVNVLSDEQAEAIEDWREQNEALLNYNRSTKFLLEAGEKLGFVEGQITDIETVAAQGLAIFGQPETR